MCVCVFFFLIFRVNVLGINKHIVPHHIENDMVGMYLSMELRRQNQRRRLQKKNKMKKNNSGEINKFCMFVLHGQTYVRT